MTTHRSLRIASLSTASGLALLGWVGLQLPAGARSGEPAPAAQAPPRDARPAPVQPRDPGGVTQAMAAGKGAISGLVVVAGTGQPARRARVNLSGADGIGSRSATADDSGGFLFAALPAGRFSLSASKTGYIEGSFGQKIPGRSGTPIQLADGQKLQVQLQVWRGSVITGTLLDEHGEAIPNTPVRVLRYALQAGQRTVQQAGGGQTDDRGIYRIFGLRPGEYLVTAMPRNNSPQAVMAEQRGQVESMLQRAAEIGAENADQARSLAERAAQMRVALSAAVVEDEQPTGYAPVYYPGTTSPASAATIVLGPSEEKSGVDFQYQVVPVSRIEGVVTGGGAQLPSNVQIVLVNSGFHVPGLNPVDTRADAQGAFRISNVPPGQYTLVGRATVGAGREGGPAARGVTPAGGRGELLGRGRAGMLQGDQIRFWGSVDVALDGRNLSNVVLTLHPGVPVSGRVAFDGASPPPADLSRLRVSLQPITAPGTFVETGPPAAGPVEADGRFTIRSVVPGRYRLTASGAGAGWIVGSSTLDGQEALEFPAEIKGAVASAMVTFIDRQSEVSGIVTNSQSQPVTDYTLVLYPADQRYRVPYSRRIFTTRPATDGRFTFRNVPAGEYRLAPVLDPEPGAWSDPEFLEQLDGRAIVVPIAEGEKKEQSIRVAGG
jgi:Carboxypeptidase regulatory-like domain